MSSKCKFLFKVIAVISWHSRNIELQHAQRYIIIKLKLGNKIDKKGWLNPCSQHSNVLFYATFDMFYNNYYAI